MPKPTMQDLEAARERVRELEEALRVRAPKPPTSLELAKARQQVNAALAQAQTYVKTAQGIMDKYGFSVEFLNKKYVPLRTDDSMWMPSDDEVEDSGRLDFYWGASTEGGWVSDNDINY